MIFYDYDRDYRRKAAALRERARVIREAAQREASELEKEAERWELRASQKAPARESARP